MKNDTGPVTSTATRGTNRLDTITFLTQTDPDTAYNALAAGEADTANIPPAQVDDAQENWGTTLDTDDPRLVLLRLQRPRPVDRRRREPPAPSGDLPGHRPRGDQRRRLRRLACVVDGHHASRHPRASRKGSASTASYDPRRRPGALRRVDRRRRCAGRADQDPVQRRCRSRGRRGHHHREPGRDRHPGRGRSADRRRRTSATWPTGSARSAAPAGSPTTRRTTTSCTTCSTPTRSVGTTSALSNPEFDALVDRGQGDRRRRRAGRPVPAGRADPPERSDDGRPDQLVPR